MQRKDISIVTQKKLLKLLTYTGKKEQQLELARQNLCKIESFEPYASFQRIDRFCRGYLTPKDILTFLRDNAIDSCEEVDAKLVIHYFDATEDGKLLYSDYLQMLLPCDQPYLRAQASQRPTYPITQKDFLPFEVERALAKLIQRELILARKQEIAKQELAARYDCDLSLLFKEVDDWNYKYIDHKNLKRFLSKLGSPASEQNLIAILRRFDLDADAKLSLQEFSQGVSPLLDFSKRQVKERATRPSVNCRELVLSPGRVPETLAVNKEDTVNVHHSPLRARANGGASARSHRPARDVSQSKGQSESTVTGGQGKEKKVKRKQSVAKTKRKQSKSKLRTHRVQTAQVRSNVYKQLQSDSLMNQITSFQKNKVEQKDDNSQERETSHKQENTRLEALISSPYQSYNRDQSPLRMKTTSTPGKGSLCQAVLRNTFSPKSPIRGQTAATYFSEQSPLNGERLGLIRNARSPYKHELAKAEEGDASLIYLTRDAFREILAIEGSLEEAKKELGMRPDFTLAGAFCKFSDNTHGRINVNDVLFGLEKLGVPCELSDARMLIDRYDSDKDLKLGFWEFSNAIMPIQSPLRDEIERRRAIFDMSTVTLDLLKKTFRKLIDTESMIEGIRQRVQRQKSLQLRQAFDSLDWLGRGFITDNEFKRAFENIAERLGSAQLHQEIVIRAKDSLEMEAMIRRFNKDKLNGRISLPEFLEELSPKVPEKTY